MPALQGSRAISGAVTPTTNDDGWSLRVTANADVTLTNSGWTVGQSGMFFPVVGAATVTFVEGASVTLRNVAGDLILERQYDGATALYTATNEWTIYGSEDAVPNLAVTTGKLADGAVTTGKLADGAVTGPKLETTSGVTPAAGDKILLRDASNGDALAHALFSSFTGGGAAWTNDAVRYVTLDGDDSNDGLTWATAKRTVRAGVVSLPIENNNTAQASHAGTVHVGPGLFVEPVLPIPLNRNTRIFGSGVGANVAGQWDDSSTVIQAGNNTNADVFGPVQIGTTAFTDWAHNVHLADFQVRGNKANNPTGGYGVRIYRAGFNCVVERVTVQSCKKNGFYWERSQANGSMRDTGARFNDEPGVHIEVGAATSGNLMTVHNHQSDNNRDASFLITSATGAKNNVIVLTGLQNEVIAHHATPSWNGTDEDQVDVVRIDQTAAQNPIMVIVDGCAAQNEFNVGRAIVSLSTLPGTGNGANSDTHVEVRGVNTSPQVNAGYNFVIFDEANGNHEVGVPTNGDSAKYRGNTNLHEWRGGVRWTYSTAAASGTPPDGSIWVRYGGTNGGMSQRRNGAWVTL